nr:rhox homeobox family member 2 [Pan paniscus]XP_034806717.1 rhox homeobox family member 2-like [Pan paniscus]
MQPPDQCSQYITSLLSPGVDEEKELQDMNAMVLSLTEEAEEEEEDAQPEPEQGTAAGEKLKSAGAQGGEEKDGGGGEKDGGGAEVPGHLWEGNLEGTSRSDGNVEDSDQSEKEPGQQDSRPQGAVGGLEPGNAFTPLQLQELERIFQCEQFPSEFLRRWLARSMNVTELAVQIWFENRRAKWERHQRASMARNMLPFMAVGQPVMVTAAEAIMAPLFISGMRDGYFWGHSHSSSLCFPMPPFPPPSLPLPLMLLPPMPPAGQAEFGPFPFVIVPSFTFPNV